MPEVMTLKEAARYLKIHPDTLVTKAVAGEVPAAKVGRQWRFLKDELDEWLRGGGTHEGGKAVGP